VDPAGFTPDPDSTLKFFPDPDPDADSIKLGQVKS
jgi:hypothetical protein